MILLTIIELQLSYQVQLLNVRLISARPLHTTDRPGNRRKRPQPYRFWTKV